MHAVTSRRFELIRSAPPRRQVALATMVVAAGVATLAAFGVAGAVLDEPFRVFTKEPVEQFDDVAPYTGVLAHLTWMLWAAAGAISLFTAVVRAQIDATGRDVRFLIAAGGLTAVLLLDDVVMLHDRALPRVGVPEEALYAGYAGAFVVILLRFPTQVLRGDVLIALASGAAWALSLVADFLQEHAGIHAHAFEDGAKMIGAALWALYLVRWSVLALERSEATAGVTVD